MPTSASDAIAIIGQFVYGAGWRRRMAEYLGCSTKTLYRWENDITQMTEDPQVLVKLADLVEETARRFPKELAAARTSLHQSFATYVAASRDRKLDMNTRKVLAELAKRFEENR